jgi:hypothetical protein
MLALLTSKVYNIMDSSLFLYQACASTPMPEDKAICSSMWQFRKGCICKVASPPAAMDGLASESECDINGFHIEGLATLTFGTMIENVQSLNVLGLQLAMNSIIVKNPITMQVEI